MSEWRRGWRIVLGAAIGGGLGVSLLFFTSSLFVIPMSAELGGSRGDMANMQALVAVGAFTAPFIGWATDRWGFRAVYTASALVTVATQIWVATWVSSLALFAVGAAVFGAVAVGTGPLTYTRPVNSWFDRQRGMALGLAASGLALCTIIFPPFLAAIIEGEGWRAGYLGLAALGGLIGLPAVLLLVRNEPPSAIVAPQPQKLPQDEKDRGFLRLPIFWVLTASYICMAIPGTGFIGQMSPLMQEEGLSATTAALGLSAYAVGQISGRLIAGFALDRVSPQLVGLLSNAVPAIGFVLLWATNDIPAIAIGAAALIGFQQGAEIDLFAYIIARRFGMKRYGAVYGSLIGLGWIGNAIGILSFGWSHDATGSYALVQIVSAVLLVIGAFLVASVKLPPAAHATPPPE